MNLSVSDTNGSCQESSNTVHFTVELTSKSFGELFFLKGCGLDPFWLFDKSSRPGNKG